MTDHARAEPDGHGPAAGHAESDVLLEKLSRLSSQALITLVLLTAVFMVTAYLSNSLTIKSNMLGCAISLAVQLFTYEIIRVMRNSNSIRFPYGSGKLENFSGFLFGALKTPVSLFIIFEAVERLIHPPTDISFTIAQLPIIPSLLRSFYFYSYAKRIRTEFESPIAEQFEVDQKISIYFYIYVMLAMGLGFILKEVGLDSLAVYVDPLFSLGVAIYSLRAGVGQLLKNFRILVDLPIPESEQIQVVKALASEFDNYESVGRIYTRRSGTTRFVAVELFFGGGVTVAEIDSLSSRLEGKLLGSLSGIRLHVIPFQVGHARPGN